MATTAAVKDDSTWCARSACSRQCSPTCCTKRSDADSGSAHRSAVGRALYRRVVERVRFAPRGRRGQVGEPCDGRDAMAWAAQCGERPRLDTLFPAHELCLPSLCFRERAGRRVSGLLNPIGIQLVWQSALPASAGANGGWLLVSLLHSEGNSSRSNPGGSWPPAMRGSPLPPCGLSCFSSCAGAGLRFACSDSATRRSTRDNFSQRTQQPVHFLYRVVVEEPDAQKPPVLFDVQLFGEIQRVIVAIPREEAAFTQLGRQFELRVCLSAHRDGWTALIKPLRI